MKRTCIKLGQWSDGSEVNLHFLFDKIVPGVREEKFTFWPVLDTVHQLALPVTFCDIVQFSITCYPLRELWIEIVQYTRWNLVFNWWFTSLTLIFLPSD